MKRQIMLLMLAGLLAAAITSCASLEYWGTTNPPVARIKVFNYRETTDIGIATRLYFSVTNVTDQELRDLTLTVTVHPSDGVVLPYQETTIDRIGPNATWTPAEPFMVTDDHSGNITVFFTVSQNGKYLAKDYAIIHVDSMNDRDHEGHDEVTMN